MAEQLEARNAKEGIGKTLRNAWAQIVEHVGSVKEAARDTVEKLAVKATDPYEEVIAEYNAAFTAMYDRGLSLLRQRERSADLIELVELLVNSIANTPKSFETSFHEIGIRKADFLDAEEFARKDLEAAQQSAPAPALGYNLVRCAAYAHNITDILLWISLGLGRHSGRGALRSCSPSSLPPDDRVPEPSPRARKRGCHSTIFTPSPPGLARREMMNFWCKVQP